MSNDIFDQRARADLGIGFPTEFLTQIVQRSKQEIAAGGDGIDGLLAAILQSQARCNGNYKTYPFSVAAGQKLQVLPQNPNRTALVVSISTLAGDFPVAGVLLDSGPLTADAATTDDIQRCVQIDTNMQSIFDFNVAPVNFVTMVSCNATALRGVIFEAS